MKIKTSELIDCALDWAVAKALGHTPRIQRDFVTLSPIVHNIDWDRAEEYSPSTNWSQGGPIIDREHICVLAPIVRRIGAERHALEVTYWRAMKQSDEDTPCIHGRGPSPLIAAMRCFVSSKLGDEVDVPEELA